MVLSENDARLFYRLMWPLQFFVNQRLQLLPHCPTEEAYQKLTAEQKLKVRVREVLYKNIERAGGLFSMAYRLKTFRVQFVAEPADFPTGSPCPTSEDVQRVARAIYDTLDADKEHFILLAMNNKNRVNGFKVVSTGSLTASLVHPREVWRAVLHLCAAAVVLVHNHPSGDPAPSPEDHEITRRLKETGDVLGIRVLDQVVLGHERFFSFSDRGLL